MHGSLCKACNLSSHGYTKKHESHLKDNFAVVIGARCAHSGLRGDYYAAV